MYIKSKGWNEFLTLCQKVEARSQLDELFDLFFTMEEEEQLAIRVGVKFGNC